MNAEPNIEDLDRALTRAVARSLHSSRPSSLRPLSWSSHLRRLWDRHRSWIKATIYGAGVLLLLLAGHYRTLFGFLLFLLPLWIADYREQRRQLEALVSDEEFLAAEREEVQQRYGREVFQISVMLAFAALMGVAAAFGKHPLAAGTVAGLVSLVAALRWALFLPGLERELVDLGGDPRKGRLFNALIAILFLFYILALPFILLSHAVRSVARRLGGASPERDAQESDARASDEDSDEDSDQPRGGARS